MEKNEISISDLLKIGLKWIHVLLAGMLIFGIALYVYASNFVVPQYRASTRYCIQTRGQSIESDVLDSQRTVAYAQLVLGTYIDILDTRDFSEEIAFYMNGNTKETDSEEKKAALAEILEINKDSDKVYTADGIRKMIKYKSEEEKISFDVDVDSVSHTEAFAIARCIETAASEYIEEKYPGVGVVTVIDKAIHSDKPVNNRVLLMTVAGVLLGAILAFALVYILECTDTRIKDEQTLSEKTGLAVIGVIPDMSSEGSQK